MKIGGKTYEAQPRRISVRTTGGEEVVLMIKPLPPGFLEQEPDVLPEPSTPHRFATRPGSKKLLRDHQGRPIVVPDDENPPFQQAMLRQKRARVARALHTALLDDPSVEWTTKRSDFESAAAYFYALAEEMEAGGLGIAAQMDLYEAVLEISGLNVREARDAGLTRFHDRADGDAGDGGESADG